ncbi:hypothetical protein [Bradyrhizobium ottawaense]|uniref:hypothetical protein n=1 Tax=Bradyrhizobium ottawaense TaxID=931866 RepID=UPI0030F3D282
MDRIGGGSGDNVGRVPAGPGGGVRLLRADTNTPVESILDENAIKANSFLRGKTAGWGHRLGEQEDGERPGVKAERMG